MDHPIPIRRPDIVIKKKKKTFHQVDFDVPVDHRVKIKGSEKIYNVLDLVRELSNLLHMKVTVLLIVGNALGTVPKRQNKGIS